MNRKSHWNILCLILFMALAACGGGGTTKVPPPVETIAVTSGSAQSAVINTAFANPLKATVATGGVPNAGVTVTFTAPASGASGTFASGAATAMATTDANGVATSPIFTANGTAGGPYIMTAAATGVTTPASFTLTNTLMVAASGKFAFYLSGEEVLGYVYAMAGSVTIDANGNVLGGEQDFNDGFVQGTSTITGGRLVADAATGQGTLTLIPDPTVLIGTGGNGIETMGVQFANPNHALLIEIDEGATSSGSLDFQTLSIPAPTAQACTRDCGVGNGVTVTLNGNYAFALSGLDSSYGPVVVGGVFSVDDSGTLTGALDANGAVGGLTTGIPFGATVTAPDGNGRGTITTSGIDGIVSSLAYYIIGPEAVRIIDKDDLSSAVGSAFGQGSGGFLQTSLGPSVFKVASNEFSNIFVAAGRFTTNATDLKPAAHKDGIVLGPTFSGIGDENEEGVTLSNGTQISGTYSIGTNGYGNLTITNNGLGNGDISSFGIYMVDPAMNISDPNSTTGGGGALVADLDESFIGIGVLLPQTDSSVASFQGNYAFGMHVLSGCVFYLGCEVDFLGQGSIDAGGLLTGGGFLSDPNFLYTDNGEEGDVTFLGNADPDAGNLGRYTMFAGDSLAAGFSSTTKNYSAVIYQANGDQLLWIENNDDNARVFSGSLQQRLLPAPALTKKAATPAKLKLKPKPKQ